MSSTSYQEQRSWTGLLSGIIIVSVGFSIHDEDTDIARPATQGAHYHEDVIKVLWYSVSTAFSRFRFPSVVNKPGLGSSSFPFPFIDS